MVRIAFALMLFAAAAAAADRDVERAAREVRRHAARVPFGVALDSYLRTAQLLGATEPQLAWEFAAAAVGLLKADGREIYEAGRVVRGLMELDPVRGEPLARSLPGRRYALGGLVNYWLAKEEPGRAADLVREGWREGVYLEPGSVLRALAENAGGASALFADLLAAFPAENATTDEVRVLMRAIREMSRRDVPAAVRGLERAIAAVTAEKFNSRGATEMAATYKLGETSVTARGARACVLLEAGIYLHALDDKAYDRHRELFEPWQREIAAVKKENMADAASAQTTTSMRKDLFSSGVPLPQPPPAFDERLSFAEAMAKVNVEPAHTRAASFMRLLLRPKLSEAEQLEAARESLRMLPEASFQGGRLRAATDLFAMAGEKGWQPLVPPGAAALELALADLANCREPSCEVVRNGPDLTKAYETLAAGARRAGIEPRTADPGLAARIGILELKGLLDRKFDFDLAGIDGTRQRLTGHRGNVVLMTFWASW